MKFCTLACFLYNSLKLFPSIVRKWQNSANWSSGWCAHLCFIENRRVKPQSRRVAKDDQQVLISSGYLCVDGLPTDYSTLWMVWKWPFFSPVFSSPAGVCGVPFSLHHALIHSEEPGTLQPSGASKTVDLGSITGSLSSDVVVITLATVPISL